MTDTPPPFCRECGCVTGDPALHQRWHQQLGYPTAESEDDQPTGEPLLLRLLPTTIDNPDDWLGEPVWIGEQFYVVTRATDKTLTLTPFRDPHT